MAMCNYLTTAALSEIVRYDDESRDTRDTRDSVGFEGAVRKHPYDSNKFLFITHPGDSDSRFYEFRITDVVRAFDKRQVVNENGETVQLVELRVRRGSYGIEMRPFSV